MSKVKLVLQRFLAGCLLSTPIQALVAQPSNGDFPVLAADDGGVGSGILQPCFAQLEGEVHCGRFRVFEDREANSGRAIDLAFVIARAFDADAGHNDAITFFFGGPGASSIALASNTINSDRGRKLRQHRDLLFLDFRGVGRSSALYCDVPYPSGISSRFGTLFPVDHAKACRDKLIKTATLEHYHTAANMDDLNDLRAWLGYQALNLIGGSYGTREIQVYLRRHPASARVAVLNGVSPIFKTSYITHARRLQQALDTFVAECAADEACATAYPNFGEQLGDMLQLTKSNPPTVMADGVKVPFGHGEFGYALRGLLYGRADEIPQLIDGAAQGDWQPLADYYLERTNWVGASDGLAPAGMHFSVLCAEDISRVSRQDIAEQTEGTFLGDYLIGGYKNVCDIWPHAKLAPDFFQPVVSDVPALLLSGKRDPVTPPSGADAVGRHLSNSLHITITDAGHGVGGRCVNDIEVEFIQAGTLKDLDTSCLTNR